jgi:hypothetical protein
MSQNHYHPQMTSEKAKLKQKDEMSLLRLPAGMRDKISAAAKQNHRSINSELVHRLEASFAVPDDIVAACNALPNVIDRMDFAVRLFQRAGFNVVIPDKAE